MLYTDEQTISFQSYDQQSCFKRSIMSKVLLSYAHPGHGKSFVNKELAKVAKKAAGVTFQDLYEKYPRFNIDVDEQQQLLLEHDVIIFQFPLFWYSTPSIIKEWFDLVLEYGFAYGKQGDRLRGKGFMLVLSAGAPEEAYAETGFQNYPLRDFLRPLEQTAQLCKMNFIPPYVMFSAIHERQSVRLEKHIHGYQKLLNNLVKDQIDLFSTEKNLFYTYETI